MQFILTKSPQEGIAALSNRLIGELNKSVGRTVLWLTSGGSNVPLTIEAMNNIPENLSRYLTIMPNDERYGEVGHAESNWQELFDAGFNPKQAQLLPVLEEGYGFAETAKRFEKTARDEFARHDVIISQLGMGPDGHISGILPNTTASAENSAWVKAYEHPPLRRITLTFPALRAASIAYLFAFGEAKRPALENLRDRSLSLQDQPAQVLWELPEVYVYNDQIGDRA